MDMARIIEVSGSHVHELEESSRKIQAKPRAVARYAWDAIADRYWIEMNGLLREQLERWITSQGMVDIEWTEEDLHGLPENHRRFIGAMKHLAELCGIEWNPACHQIQDIVDAAIAQIQVTRHRE